jgi:hypothetical protein
VRAPLLSEAHRIDLHSMGPLEKSLNRSCCRLSTQQRSIPMCRTVEKRRAVFGSVGPCPVLRATRGQSPATTFRALDSTGADRGAEPSQGGDTGSNPVGTRSQTCWSQPQFWDQPARTGGFAGRRSRNDPEVTTPVVAVALASRTVLGVSRSLSQPESSFATGGRFVGRQVLPSSCLA